MNVAPREKFGLGSKLKKFVRNIIPNEVSEIAVKAAPFVAPFNPALAGAMAGIGGFDQTGRIGSSLKSGLLTYGGGQLARYVGGAGFQGNPFAGGGAFTPSGFMGGFSSPLGTQTGLGSFLKDKGFIGTGTGSVDPGIAKDSIFVQPGADGTTYFPSDFATEALPLEPGSITSGGQIVSGTAAQNQAILDQLAKQTLPGAQENVIKKATEKGYGDIFKDIFSKDLNKSTQALKELGGKALKDIYTTDKGKLDKSAVAATIAGASSYIEAKKLAKDAGLVTNEDEYTEEMYNADKAKYSEKYGSVLTPEAFGLKEGGIATIRKNKNVGGMGDEEILNQPSKYAGVPSIKLEEAGIEQMANGGRMGYMYGSEVPIRRNQGGITELDYRNTGGFVPIGVKEKADDVPAMLSKNEFVFTADAVRAAGGGSINKGAKRMYDTMKALENKVV